MPAPALSVSLCPLSLSLCPLSLHIIASLTSAFRFGNDCNAQPRNGCEMIVAIPFDCGEGSVASSIVCSCVGEGKGKQQGREENQKSNINQYPTTSSMCCQLQSSGLLETVCLVHRSCTNKKMRIHTWNHDSQSPSRQQGSATAR